MSIRCTSAMGELLVVALMFSPNNELAEAASFNYSSPPIQGRAISADTGLPIAGVSVFIGWRLYYSVSNLHIAEAVTGDDGTFVISGWGPTSLPEPVSLKSPTIVLFERSHLPVITDLQRFTKKGDQYQIRLGRFDGSPEEWVNLLNELFQAITMLIWIPSPPSTPRIVLALEAERQRLPEEARNKVAGLREFEFWMDETRRAMEEEKRRKTRE